MINDINWNLILFCENRYAAIKASAKKEDFSHLRNALDIIIEQNIKEADPSFLYKYAKWFIKSKENLPKEKVGEALAKLKNLEGFSIAASEKEKTVIAIEEEKEIKLNRYLLDYYCLNQEMEKWKTYSAATLKLFKQFLYSGLNLDTDLNRETVCQLYALAIEQQVPSLAEFCRNYYTKKIIASSSPALRSYYESAITNNDVNAQTVLLNALFKQPIEADWLTLFSFAAKEGSQDFKHMIKKELIKSLWLSIDSEARFDGFIEKANALKIEESEIKDLKFYAILALLIRSKTTFHTTEKRLYLKPSYCFNLEGSDLSPSYLKTALRELKPEPFQIGETSAIASAAYDTLQKPCLVISSENYNRFFSSIFTLFLIE